MKLGYRKLYLDIYLLTLKNFYVWEIYILRTTRFVRLFMV